MTSKTLYFCNAIVFAFVFTMGCAEEKTTSDAGSTNNTDDITHSGSITELSGLLPGDARGTLAVDISALLVGTSATQVTALLSGTSGDPALKDLFFAINKLGENIDLTGVMKTALLAQTTDASKGLFLIAKLSCDTIGEATKGPDLTPDGTYGTGAHAMHLDVNGNSVSLLEGGVLIVGKKTAVQSVLDVADGVSPANASDIVPFLSALKSDSSFSFVYGLPAMFNSEITPDRSLSGAQLVSGSLDFDGANISGSVSFHTPGASDFVEAYNLLDSESGEAPLVLNEPIANDLSQVVVTVPSTPIDKSADSLITSRNILKKLFVGMVAHDYAVDVHDPGNSLWTDMIVKSEADGDGSPGSVFIRWEFKDQAAIEAFEANELPAEFTLADCQFLESDEPGKFLLLNMYNVTGILFKGARAEWDVFVNPPAGGPDPNAGTRPRFMVVDALAETLSVDSVHVITPAEPLSHKFVDDQVVSSVHKIEDGVEITLIESSFPKPSPTATVARFTREMAICNDYIYWGHGVFDRAFYNATTFNYDALFADTAQIQITDNTHWKQYLKPDPTYAVYYLNTLEYVVSPWANLASPKLDITSEWLKELYDFKNMETNYPSLMKDYVVDLFKGKADVRTQIVVENATPATYYNFTITDPEAMSAALNLPADYSLAKTRFFQNDSEEDYYLTLSIYEIQDSVEGTRAEWSVYVDEGNGRERFMIIDLQTEDAAVDPVSLINLPSKVSHNLASDTLSTSLSSMTIDFDASFNTAGGTEEPLTLDWIEAGDFICHINGICDKFYYDAETLDIPVHLPAAVTINTISTPWNEFIDTTESTVFYRDNLQQLATKPWQNLRVIIEDSAQTDPDDDSTHVITGTGTMTGRGDNPALDATYTYTGSGTLGDNNFVFTVDQLVENALGETHISSTGSFDLTTGLGTSTVTGCNGEVLVCGSVDPFVGTPEATTDYTATNLDASDPDNISWDVVSDMNIPGFGIADLESHFTATKAD